MLLFEGGKRPDAQAARKIVDKLDRVSISLNPLENQKNAQTDASAGQQAESWLELLNNGMTFDLVGLSPGPTINVPMINHRVNLPDNFLETTYEAVEVRPGPHISSGSNSFPVVRGLLGVVAGLAAECDPIQAICWPPAALIAGTEFFRANAESWIGGGPFPSHVLTGFKPMTDGGLQSEGLAYFTGQEIRIEPGSVGDYSTATVLAGRLVQQLAQHGALTQTEEVMAPDGSQMRLEPSGNRKFVRVWRS